MARGVDIPVRRSMQLLAYPRCLYYSVSSKDAEYDPTHSVLQWHIAVMFSPSMHSFTFL